MTDFETRVREIMSADTPDLVKLAEIRKICAPTIRKNDRLYRVIVNEALIGSYETIGWLAGGEAYSWCARNQKGIPFWVDDEDVTILGEYVPEDKHYGRVYERIEDAVADGMGKNSIVLDRDGDTWEFDATDKYGMVFSGGQRIENEWGPFTVVHWKPKEVWE